MLCFLVEAGFGVVFGVGVVGGCFGSLFALTNGSFAFAIGFGIGIDFTVTSAFAPPFGFAPASCKAFSMLAAAAALLSATAW